MLGLSELAPPLDGRPIYSQSRLGRAYFAVGNTIYSTGACVEKVATLPFQITHLVLNHPGTTLAAAAGCDVWVLDITSKERQSVFQLPSPIIDMVWHPLGVSGMCLTVLVAGAVVSHYNSARGVVTETLHLKPEHHGAFDVDFAADDTVSLAFGRDNATGPLTLFLGTSDGDLYGLCPYVPCEFSLGSENLRDLLDDALASDYRQKTEVLTTTNVDEIRHGQQVLTRQLKWVQDIIRQASTQNSDSVVIGRPQRPPPTLQGPLRLVPFPDQLYGETVLDIASCSLENVTLIIQLMAGYVNFFLQDTPLQLSWSSCLAKPEPLALIESVKLPQNLDEAKLEVLGQYVFVQSAHSTLCLEVSGWQNALAACIHSGGPLPALPPTKLHKLDKSLLVDHHTYVAATSMVSYETTKWLHGAQRPIDSVPKALPLPDSTEYLSLVNSNVVDQITGFMEKISLATNVDGPLAITNDAATLAKLNTLAAKFERDMALLYKSISVSVNHVHMLRSELHRQLANAASLQETLRTLDRQPVLDKLAACSLRQENIAKRVSELSKLLLHSTMSPLPLSEPERRFAAEVGRVNDAVGESAKSSTLSARVNRASADVQNLQLASQSPERAFTATELQEVKLRANHLGSRLTELTSELKAAAYGGAAR